MIRILQRLLQAIQDAGRGYHKLPGSLQWLLQVVVVSLFLLIAPGGARLFWPVVMLLFWGMATLDSRTLSNSGLLAFFILGFTVLPFVASSLETPLIFIFGDNNVFADSICVFLEASLLTATLVGISLWKGSRLRYTGGIVDFAMIGLALGSGMECLMGCLLKNAPGHQGVGMGVLPQWPGLLGHASLQNACASPALWGLGIGLLAGMTRYLLGPDFKKAQSYGREVALGLAAFFVIWLALERAAYLSNALPKIAENMYWLDLKGRLFVYAAMVFMVLTILVEWLLIQERSHTVELEQLAKTLERSMAENNEKSWLGKVRHLHQTLTLRRWLRERIIAEENRHFFNPQEQTYLDQRLRQVTEMMDAKGAGQK